MVMSAQARGPPPQPIEPQTGDDAASARAVLPATSNAAVNAAEPTRMLIVVFDMVTPFFVRVVERLTELR